MGKRRDVDAITWGRDGHVGFEWGEDVDHGGGGGARDGVCLSRTDAAVGIFTGWDLYRAVLWGLQPWER